MIKLAGHKRCLLNEGGTEGSQVRGSLWFSVSMGPSIKGFSIKAPYIKVVEC